MFRILVAIAPRVPPGEPKMYQKCTTGRHRVSEIKVMDSSKMVTSDTTDRPHKTTTRLYKLQRGPCKSAANCSSQTWMTQVDLAIQTVLL